MSIVTTQVDIRPCEICGKKATKVVVMLSTESESKAVSKCSCDAHLDQVQEEADTVLRMMGFEGDSA